MLNRKSVKISLLLFSIAIFLSGCSYKEYYTDTIHYSIMWENKNFLDKYDGISPFFPEDAFKADVKKFFCCYDAGLFSDNSVQIFLKVKYDNSEFETEIKRLAEMSTYCDDEFSENEHDFSAYSTYMGEDGFYEYALIDTEKKMIYYICLQHTKAEEVEFSHEVLPDNY